MSVLRLLLFLLPLYMLFRLGRIKANWVVLLIFALIEGGFLAAAILLQRHWIFFASGSLVLILFDLFYDDEPFLHQVRWLLPILSLVTLFALLLPLRQRLISTPRHKNSICLAHSFVSLKYSDVLTLTRNDAM